MISDPRYGKEGVAWLFRMLGDKGYLRVSLTIFSASKGLPEKEYAFDLQLYAEIIPEVSLSYFNT